MGKAKPPVPPGDPGGIDEPPNRPGRGGNWGEPMSDPEKIRGQIRQIRSLILAGKQRIAALRPVWGAYLAGEAMNGLTDAVDQLEREIGLAPAAVEDADAAEPSAGWRDGAKGGS